MRKRLSAIRNASPAGVLVLVLLCAQVVVAEEPVAEEAIAEEAIAEEPVAQNPPAEEARASRSPCDQRMEDYLRSSARKVSRGIDRGSWNYQLQEVVLEEPFVVDKELIAAEEELSFEIFREAEGRLVAIIDRQREWEYTYIIAHSSIGPIIVSQQWQPRHLRDAGQACEPIASAVEWPIISTPAVDIEPFRYWGLRISWKIPPMDRAEVVQRELADVLREVVSAHGEKGSDPE